MPGAAAWCVVVLVSSLVSHGSLTHGSLQEREKCMIDFLDGCRLQLTNKALEDEYAAAYNHMDVGASEGRCLARPKEIFEWCGNELHQQIMATYIPTGEVFKVPGVLHAVRGRC